MTVKKVLVIGLGRFGTALVGRLWREKAEVVAVDLKPEAVDAVKDRAGHAYVGDGTNPKVLEAVGAGSVDAAVVTFGMAFEATVLCVASLHRMGVRYVVARAETPRQADILTAVGAARVVQIEAEMGHRLGLDLVSPVAADLLDLASDYRVVPWVAQGPLVGQTLAQADLRRRYELIVLGYRRRPKEADAGARTRLLIASPDYVIEAGDTLLIVGPEGNVARFFEELGGER